MPNLGKTYPPRPGQRSRGNEPIRIVVQLFRSSTTERISARRRQSESPASVRRRLFAKSSIWSN